VLVHSNSEILTIISLGSFLQYINCTYPTPDPLNL